DRLPVPPRPLGGRDRGGARRAARHGQVADGPRPGAPAHGGGGVNLEQELRAVPIAWPETPTLRVELAPRGRAWRRPLVLGLALVLLALAIAFAVPPARSAILRFFHLRGVTIERVDTLPDAAAKSLEAGLGPPPAPHDAARG